MHRYPWHSGNRAPQLTIWTLQLDCVRLRTRILQGLDHSFFDARYVRASARERQALKAITARGGESAKIDELRARLEMSNSDIQPLVRFLVERGSSIVPLEDE